ncbi:MAG: carbohydrate ABC transporter permease [Lachnospiraceae bacterium]|jgi:putative aldouronate transport system permease protein
MKAKAAAVSSGRKIRSKDVVAFKLIGYPFLFLFAILCLLPFLLVIGSSFQSEQEIAKYGYRLIPKAFSLESYKSIFSNPGSIIRAYGVTTFVTVVGTAASTFINMMTGYVLMRKDFDWRNKFSFYFFFTTLFSGGLMPWYMVCIALGFRDNIMALIIPGMISVWNIILVKGFTAGIPYEIIESAKIDGAGDFQIFIRLIWPLSTPVIATISLFTALGYWNSWYNTMLFIHDEKLYSLQYLLYKLINDAQALRDIASESGEVINTVPIESMKMALTVIVTGPILLLYPFVQRYFIKGLTLGAVKG